MEASNICESRYKQSLLSLLNLLAASRLFRADGDNSKNSASLEVVKPAYLDKLTKTLKENPS